MNILKAISEIFPKSVDPFILSGFIIYLIGMLFIGFWTCRRNKNNEDFLLAGRSLGPWVTAFSERASGESAWLLLGLPGAGLAVGLGEIWTCLGCISGIIFSWYVISYRLRIQTEKLSALTLPEYFAKRTGDETNLIRAVSSLIIIFFFTFYVSAQFNGAGKVLNVTFGFSQTTGVLLGAAVILFYTIMGGFLAVAWTDLVQGIIMICTLVILPLAALIEFYHGHTSFVESARQVSPHLMNLFKDKTGWMIVPFVLGGLSWGLGYMGQPHLLTRFMAIRDPAKLKQGRFIAIAWAVPAFFGALAIGLVGVTLYGKGQLSDPEKIMPFLATQLLPGWLAGIFISGAIAAMMSTADSQLLVTTSSIAEDFLHKILKVNPKPETLLYISRISTFGVGLIAIILGLNQKKLVFEIVSYAWSGLGAAFGPALLISLYSKRVSRAGILAGMITGALTTIIWSQIKFLDQNITHRLSSWILAALAVIIFSALFPKDARNNN